MKGLLLIDKPSGLTSFSAVNTVKRKATEKRVGHTGTLDPMATGVLPVLLGRATALSSLLLEGDKGYIAEIKLGVTTDTDDITGNALEENEVRVTNAQLESVLEKFKGKITQTPPIYSAIKKDGVRLYKLAREGKTAEIPQRQVEIFKIDLLEPLNSEGIFKIDTLVSKGTYIRSLARDIGKALGCGATLYSLRRTKAGQFDIKDCVPLDALNSENLKDYILSEETVVSHLEEITVTKPQAIRFCNGGQLSFDRLNTNTDNFTENQLFRVKCGDEFLGVGYADLEKRQIAIKCVIKE